MKNQQSLFGYWGWTAIAMLSGGGAAGMFWCIWYLSAGSIPVVVTEHHHHLGSRAWDVVAIPAIILLFAATYWLTERVYHFLMERKRPDSFVGLVETLFAIGGITIMGFGFFNDIGFVVVLVFEGFVSLLHIIFLGGYLLYRAVRNGPKVDQPMETTGAH